jgi:hypothetical protein
MHDPRAVSASRYWASRPGNWLLAGVFDREDAQQTAALELLLAPDATWGDLYRRVQSAAGRVALGYRQRQMIETVALDDDIATDGDAERATLLHERIRILEALPPAKRAIVDHWLDGDDDEQAGAAHGMTGAGWRYRRNQLFNDLQRRGL